MKNNTTNRIKKRADTLADFFIERYERLEQENHLIKKSDMESHLKLREYENAFEKALDKIIEIEKNKRNNYITIIFKGENNNDDMDKLFTDFTQDDPMYPLAEMLLEKYEKRKAFEKLVKKGWIMPIKEPK